MSGAVELCFVEPIAIAALFFDGSASAVGGLKEFRNGLTIFWKAGNPHAVFQFEWLLI